jgi:hypothetical protein
VGLLATSEPVLWDVGPAAGGSLLRRSKTVRGIGTNRERLPFLIFCEAAAPPRASVMTQDRRVACPRRTAGALEAWAAKAKAMWDVQCVSNKVC